MASTQQGNRQRRRRKPRCRSRRNNESQSDASPAGPWAEDPWTTDTWATEPLASDSCTSEWDAQTTNSATETATTGSAKPPMTPERTNPPTLRADTRPNSPPQEPQILVKRLVSKCHPASILLTHHFTIPSNGTVERRGKTTEKSIPAEEFSTLPIPSPMTTEAKRKAIVMDCEMVEAHGGRLQLAFLAAIDFLTGETLIDHHVQPREPVVHWNTQYSGVSQRTMDMAMKLGRLLDWEEARDRLRSLADTDTVLIGHALFNDLHVLRFAHLRIVDSSVLACSAVFPDQAPEKSVPRSWSLKCLAKELLGYRIQGGRSGHSAMEDSRATRDLVMFCLEEPEKLRQWAVAAREVEDKLVAKRERSRERAKAAREKMEKEAREHTARKEAAGRQDPWGGWG
ncbi:Exonuclease RNase T/DNA polymerase III [Penicillium verhagenii]|uniref:Exonuclease RNase T/DNA polymerase III n=1 Tax=Penicillium verhagenii TaxID=1562060 RepID=UPI002545AB1D|nr:Exonuclease RNase T/DNA polymerase III [Penicillium verhagenii]KAJ5930052.1 Exonuclease RNase T/DNA polymerase III [Penicillium verhagenii]